MGLQRLYTSQIAHKFVKIMSGYLANKQPCVLEEISKTCCLQTLTNFDSDYKTGRKFEKALTNFGCNHKNKMKVEKNLTSFDSTIDSIGT